MRINIERYNLSRSQVEYLIDQWIFNERDRAILKRRLLDRILFEDLADEFCLSTVQIKSIVYRSMDKLEKHL